MKLFFLIVGGFVLLTAQSHFATVLTSFWFAIFAGFMNAALFAWIMSLPVKRQTKGQTSWPFILGPGVGVLASHVLELEGEIMFTLTIIGSTIFAFIIVIFIRDKLEAAR